ncbi:MAG: hypothetical protein LBR81_06175 [Prevotellaceae bacterium]|jgi:DNA-directed RNA polymerase specialized sigma24 family protein|nr:hypothetical protein [Prevotellaceae bacterium]
MPHKELVKLIADEKPDAARNLFLEIVKQKKLYRNAFAYWDIKPHNDYKQSILDNAFLSFYQKVQYKNIANIDNEYVFRGAIVNTLKESGRKVYLKEQMRTEYSEFFPEIPFDPENDLLKEDKIELVLRCLNNMGEKCQKIIRYKHLYNYSHEEIVEENMDIKDIISSRVKLANCMNELRKMVFKEYKK